MVTKEKDMVKILNQTWALFICIEFIKEEFVQSGVFISSKIQALFFLTLVIASSAQFFAILENHEI